MALKVDYYTSLLRAVGGLERDAYAARGAVYEREHKALMRLLYSADPPRSEIEIEREQMAFRDAIRRVEFGDEDYVSFDPVSELPEDESESATYVAPTARPATTARTGAPTNAAVRQAAPQRPAAPVLVMPATARHAPARPPAIPATAPHTLAPPTAPHVSDQDWSDEPPVEEPLDHAAAMLPAEGETTADADPMIAPEEVRPGDAAELEAPALLTRKRTPLSGLLIRRTILAILLLGIGALAYGHATGEFELPWLNELAGDGTIMQLARNPDAQQAIVIDGDPSDPDEGKAVGKALWRVQSEQSDAKAAIAILQLDLEIPARRLMMSMSMRPEAAGGVMSHLIEIRFLREDHTPDADIANIGSLYMATAEQTRGTALTGRVMRVAPGVFLFGLGGLDSERERNLSNLKEQPWIDIPLTYRNGARGLLAVEKGEAGNRVISEVLAAWEK